MKKILKKYIVKIPNDLGLIYTTKTKKLIFISKTNKKSLKLNVQLFISQLKKIIKISYTTFNNISNNKLKKQKSFQGISLGLIKQIIMELSIILYQKLKFIGVGYRILNMSEFKNKLLLFKLGYSHFLYFKIIQNLNYFNLKMINLYIFGHSCKNITQFSSLIRSYKKPELYKGKGILYATEKIVLKKSKKI